jgi:hypothetical protein
MIIGHLVTYTPNSQFVAIAFLVLKIALITAQADSPDFAIDVRLAEYVLGRNVFETGEILLDDALLNDLLP